MPSVCGSQPDVVNENRSTEDPLRGLLQSELLWFAEFYEDTSEPS